MASVVLATVAAAVLFLALAGSAAAAGQSLTYTYDETSAVSTADVPIRVVLVGFEKGQIDEQKLINQIPTDQRPGVLTPYDENEADESDECGVFIGGNMLLNHGRCYYEGGSKPYFVPIEYRWKPSVVYAPTAFTTALFQQMMANSKTGDFHGTTYRPFLEAYNATRGSYRGEGNDVPAGAPVRFFDAEKTETWLAQNSLRYLGFELGPRGGTKLLGPGKKPGYTIFLLNTWSSPEALSILKPQHEYHTLLVDRTDPDVSDFAGIDWGRVWGGNYREVFWDLGAAPNPYESQTWGNRGRDAVGSAAFDPPLWEYDNGAPRVTGTGDFNDPYSPNPTFTWDKTWLEYNLGRFAVEAISYRFLHSYLYEPRPSVGRYFLSSNIWHDSYADNPWLSDLKKLYNEEKVLEGLRTLVPYFSFTGDTHYQYLQTLDADQAMIQQAKQDGGDPAATAAGNPLGSVPFTAMHTQTAMDYLDANKERFERGGACYTTIPDIEVVVEKHYAWALPVIVGGIATNNNGVPWGFLASVNDIFKTAQADQDQGPIHAAHPDALGGGFTYTSIHELSHFLGLAHPHDTIGKAVVDTDFDGTPETTEYWDGFLWTFDSTAAPTTYAFDQMQYSILDQENITQGHLAYYLKWTREALADAGVAFAADGITTTGQLPSAVARMRATALTQMATAQKLFSKFDFVRATFAAQKAWRAAAAFHDVARKLEPGQTELDHGTAVRGNPKDCPSAK
ncbi:MAG TPA: hypothetical protein VJT84_03695 [Gaiellaceae bacterium]|nr:hypothetical protein [Gaiellaceae bacterium]